MKEMIIFFGRITRGTALKTTRYIIAAFVQSTNFSDAVVTTNTMAMKTTVSGSLWN